MRHPLSFNRRKSQGGVGLVSANPANVARMAAEIVLAFKVIRVGVVVCMNFSRLQPCVFRRNNNLPGSLVRSANHSRGNRAVGRVIDEDETPRGAVVGIGIKH